MDASVTGNNRLLIRRFQAQYLVSREHPTPERVKARLDETVTRDLAKTLAAALAPWFSNSNSGLWLVRDLNVEADVNVAWEREQLARDMSSRIARSLAMSLQGGSDGENILWFPSRAAYLARFLADAAGGSAWSKWYYMSFEGLRALPVSAILRTAICENPATGRDALNKLAGEELTEVIDALTAQDACTVLDRFAAEDSAGEEFPCFQAAWAAWKKLGWQFFDIGKEWHKGIDLYLAASRDSAGSGGLPLKAAVLALLRLAHCLTDSSASQGERLVAALTRGDVETLYRAAGRSDAERLAPLILCPPHWVGEVGDTLLASSRGLPVKKAETSPGPRHTPLGGIFLLFPLVDELPLEAATHDWPDAEDIPAASLVRFLVLLKCCGQLRAARAFSDPVIRDLLGLPLSLSVQLVADWQENISTLNLQHFMETLAIWQAERGVVQDQILILALANESVAVLMDSGRGLWLYATGYTAGSSDCFDESMRDWLERNTRHESVLLCGPLLFDAARAAFPGRQVVSLMDDRARTPADDNRAVSEIPARMEKLPDELAYLSFPGSWELTPAFDLALSVAAQGMMRNFSWRLPGFAGSNLPYLFSNFLDFSGSIEDEPKRRVVLLGRPPLYLVLYMTGIIRGSYHLSWLDERPFVLFSEG